jgi:hypothetical protein
MRLRVKISQKESELTMKNLFLIAATTLVVVIATAACSAAVASPAPAANVPANQPAAVVQTTPLCQNPTTCQAPAADLVKADCVNKIPYTNVLVAPGTAYEVQDKTGAFTCKDSGQVVNGKTVLTCYGTQLMAFDLKLTNSTCSRPNLQENTGQCQPGYGFDAAQQCCAPSAGDAPGSTSVRIELGGCPLPQVHTP